MFVQRNLVTIVMIPSLIGLHWAWDSLQHNRALVSDYERKDLPVVIVSDTHTSTSDGHFIP